MTPRPGAPGGGSDEAAMLRARGADLARAGNAAGAEAAFRRAVQLDPGNPDGLLSLGCLLGQTGRVIEGLEVLRLCVQADPGLARGWLELGLLLQNHDDPGRCVEALERATSLDPALSDAYAALSVVLDKMRRPAEARAVIERGLAALPGDPQLRVFRAEWLGREGRATEAEAELVSVLGDGPPENVAHRAWHALGMALEQLGRYEESLTAHSHSNAIFARTPAAQNAARAAVTGMYPSFRSYSTITAEQCRRWADDPVNDGLADPALLVGFPRSGTTMIEQVLDAHPRVCATDEKPMLPRTEREARRLLIPGWDGLTPPAPEAWSAALDSLTQSQRSHLRAFYWRLAEQHVGGRAQAGRFARGESLLVDKHPLMITRLMLVNRLFPRARVVVMIRDPRDCVVSAFTQRFLINPAMSQFLTLGGAARLYAEVMGSWLKQRSALSLRVFELRYEDSVTEFETHARRLIGFLGLEWSDRVLHFNQAAADKFVSTPSYRAVTQVAGRDRVARWRRYGTALSEVTPVLMPMIEALGYEKT